MLSHQLQSAIKNLETIIQLTQQDIEDTKAARHDALFERTKTKEEFILAFETKKSLIDNEIAKLIESNPNVELTDLLSNEQHKMLEEFKTLLTELRSVNKRLARMVLAVSEFYNSMLSKLLPTEMQGYQSVRSSKSGFMELRA